MCSKHISSHGGSLLLPVTTGRVQPDDRACQLTTHGQVQAITGVWEGEGGREGWGRGGRKGGRKGGREGVSVEGGREGGREGVERGKERGKECVGGGREGGRECG